MLEVGRIVKPHGIKGEVVVELVTNRTERMGAGTVLRAGDRRLEIVYATPHQGRWIVQFAGLADRTAAEALRDVKLSAEPITDPDALWVHELIGSEVVDQAGAVLGTVVSVEANPASDLMVLDGGGLVPLHFVTGHEPGLVTVDPPEGLLD